MTPNRRLLNRIHKANAELPPKFVGMEFVRYVPEGRGLDSAYTWAIYLSHDPCHDGNGHVADRNTVLAFHRMNGSFKIIGRELDREFALELAEGRR